MANRQVFKSTSKKNVPVNTVNKAGGTAYKFDKEHALCQYVVTGTFNSVYYSPAKEQLSEVQKLVAHVSSPMVAKAAVYGHEIARMKDVPAYLLVVLAARQEHDLLRRAWPHVITNFKMLTNFIQILRSGVTGRRSLGQNVKRLVQEWLLSKSSDQLLVASIGHSKPSMGDVIKMAHPRPHNKVQEDTFNYFIRGYGATKYLTKGKIRHFEDFKRNRTVELPDIPFRALTNCNLSEKQWEEIARNMPWNTLRMNLNMLDRKGVFKNKQVVEYVANTIRNEELIVKNNAFPYQLLTAFQNAKVDVRIQNALQDAMEIATQNVPTLDTDVAVCIDLSDSMGSPATGYRARGTTATTCYDVAALIAACMARRNPTCQVVAWACDAKFVKFNSYDSIMTNAELFRRQNVGGGTNATKAMALLNSKKYKGDAVIYVSDNQSWIDTRSTGRWSYRQNSGLLDEWNKYKKRNRKAKLVCIDIQPYMDSQVPEVPNEILNIGGFTDSIFNVIHDFIKRGNVDFVSTVSSIEL